MPLSWSTLKDLLQRLQNEAVTTWKRLQHCPHPWRAFWMLIWPVPWKYQLPSLLDPLTIRDNPSIVHRRYYVEENYRSLRAIPIFRHRDTPTRALYRLHDCTCADEANYVMMESDYFFHHTWPIKDIPDPKDPNPIRYAMLAGIVESMVKAYNQKIELGLRHGRHGVSFEKDRTARLEKNKPFEEIPAWVSHVPLLDE